MRARQPARDATRSRNRKGFTMAELLVAMVMMVMAGSVITQSLSMSFKSYRQRTADTQAQLLCETVSLLVQDDVTRNGEKNIDYVQQEDYATGLTIDGVELRDACYGRERTVKITRTQDSGDASLYHVTVSVANAQGTRVAFKEFTVRYLSGITDDEP